jgi:hypothetical protein
MNFSVKIMALFCLVYSFACDAGQFKPSEKIIKQAILNSDKDYLSVKIIETGDYNKKNGYLPVIAEIHNHIFISFSAAVHYDKVIVYSSQFNISKDDLNNWVADHVLGSEKQLGSYDYKTFIKVSKSSKQ